MKFDEMKLGKLLLDALNKMGFEIPTPIQEQAIPALLQGEDLIGQAQTGTGKTAAFGLPALQYCMQKRKEEGHPHPVRGVAMPYVLILAPTRELAVQITGELEKMGRYTPLRVVCVYGGQSINVQLRAFEKQVDIVVGTPGRVLDHMQRENLNLQQAGYVVLDEADRMLDMGFIKDVMQIMSKTQKGRQTALFGATVPKEIENIAYEYMENPKKIRVSQDNITVEGIAQKFVQVNAGNRIGYLLSVLELERPALAVVFVRTKRAAEKLSWILQRRKFASDCLHGNMRQGARDKAMAKFRDGKIHMLVATDLASRGLDVLEVSHVINYDMPEEIMTYVHRIGRTGRMGAKGKAISFIFEDQMGLLKDIVKVTRVPMEELIVEPKQVFHSDVPRDRGRRRGGRAGMGSRWASGMNMKRMHGRAGKPARGHVRIRGNHTYTGRSR
ncbi:MAG: DEAD/DEAH box helicase [Candidatus Micrarchaeota archaeon]